MTEWKLMQDYMALQKAEIIKADTAIQKSIENALVKCGVSTIKAKEGLYALMNPKIK